jgi:Zn-finger nucleic acid-binding protein
MQCPVDGTTLQMTDRAGVEIDYCPQCRGVWLDRGELDKIIERSAPEPRGQEDRGRPVADDPRYSGGYRKKKRGGFLEELFDF